MFGVVIIYALPKQTRASMSEIPMLSNTPAATFTQTLETSMGELIPMPVSVKPGGGTFKLSAGAIIFVEPNNPEITKIGQYLADKLNPSTGFAIRVAPMTGVPANGSIYLTAVGGDPALGDAPVTA